MTGSLVILSFASQSTTGAPPAVAAMPEGSPDVGAGVGAAPPGAPVARMGIVARVEGIELVNPAPAATVLGFHEAAGPGPLPLTPAYVRVDHNADRPKPRPMGAAPDDDAVELIVLPSRGRPAEATTAMDVAVPEGAPVVSPVSGTVLSVDRYMLYGQAEDHIVRIAPDGRPDLAVKLVHIVSPRVAVGERVEAGRTPLAAGAKLLPFSSQIDRFTEERGLGIGPHVHLEVERITGTSPVEQASDVAGERPAG